jgi:putative glutamine amidotransferase
MKPRIGITLELSEKGEKRTSFLDLAYAECVKDAGGISLHFPPLPSVEFIPEALSLIDGLVLTGGADINPSFYREKISAPVVLSPDQRTDFDLALFQAALNGDKAILAICHGMQIVNVALGGTLYQDISTQVPGAIEHRGKKDSSPARHGVKVEAGSRLAGIMEGTLRFEICSTHHQAIKDLGKGLRVVARSPDGIIEGIELPANPKVIGVQWHPEKDSQSEATRRLFRAHIEWASTCKTLGVPKVFQ